jgi:hypothetical protein
MGSLAQRTTVIVPLAWQHSPSLVVRRLSCQPGWRVRFGGAIGGRIAGLMGYKGLLHDYNLTKRRYSTLPKLHTQYKMLSEFPRHSTRCASHAVAIQANLPKVGVSTVPPIVERSLASVPCELQYNTLRKLVIMAHPFTRTQYLCTPRKVNRQSCQRAGPLVGADA